MTFPADYPRSPTPAKPKNAVSPRQGALRWWWGAFRPRTAVFATPLPPAECARRLAATTAPASAGVSLRLMFGGRPSTRLVGDAGPYHVRLARPPESRRLQPWFEGAISPARHRAAIVRGTIAVPAPARVTLRVYSVLWALIVVIMTAIGLESTVAGVSPGPGILPVAGFLAAFYGFAWWVTAWQAQTGAERLIEELRDILGATNDPHVEDAEGADSGPG